MEIQKAEEFADDYREKMVSAFCWSMEKDSAMVTDLIKRVRARDKAIIERCKAICQEMREEGETDMRQAIYRIDSILRELEGGA